uniref:Uncharacterized protein n=1 Tax=Panagrolaimus davidi TaxID=227884 RepID=A0A914QDL0_9BILA
MDTSENESPATSLSTLKRKRSGSGDASDVIPAKRLHFTPPNRSYDFDLPDSIIYYIAKNPTSKKLYKKLIKTCRYFFWKKPIILIKTLVCSNNELKAYSTDFDHDVSLKDLPYEFWLTDQCSINSELNDPIKPNLVSFFIPHIYRCEIEDLSLCDQMLTIDEFLYFTTTTCVARFDNLTVVNRDGKEIAFEKLVELIPEVFTLEHRFKNSDKTVTAKTVKEILKLPHLQYFFQFRLFNVPEAFDIQLFFAHIKKSNGIFQLGFAGALSVAYQSRLEAIIDELIESQTFDYIPPFISYPGMDDEKYKKLYKTVTKNGFFFK